MELDHYFLVHDEKKPPKLKDCDFGLFIIVLREHE